MEQQTYPDSSRGKPQTWIIIISCLLSLLGISISIMMYVMPPNTFIPGLDPDSSAVAYLNSMCAARQLSIATCIGFAALRKSTPMLTLSWICYLLLNIQDALIGVSQHDSGMIGGGIVISILSVLILFKLNSGKK
jgi:hypothetical protein